METDSAHLSLVELMAKARSTGDQYREMAEIAKRVAKLQLELNILAKPQYVIEEMEPF